MASIDIGSMVAVDRRGRARVLEYSAGLYKVQIDGTDIEVDLPPHRLSLITETVSRPAVAQPPVAQQTTIE